MAHREIPPKIYSTINADKKEPTDKKYLFFLQAYLEGAGRCISNTKRAQYLDQT